MLVDLHDGGLVATPVAVVGGTEDGHHVLVVAPVVSLCVCGNNECVLYEHACVYLWRENSG